METKEDNEPERLKVVGQWVLPWTGLRKSTYVVLTSQRLLGSFYLIKYGRIELESRRLVEIGWVTNSVIGISMDNAVPQTEVGDGIRSFPIFWSKGIRASRNPLVAHD